MTLPKPNDGEGRADYIARMRSHSAWHQMSGTDEEKASACGSAYDEARKSASVSEDDYGFKALSDVSITDEGKVRAAICTLDVVDNDGEVTLPGSIPDGMKATVSAYNHDTVMNMLTGGDQPDAAPVGKGVIRIEGKQAVAYLDYFMETQRGREAFLTVKAMGPDQAWSYAYRKVKVDQPTDEWKAKGARRMLTQLGPLLDGAMEVSPVKMPGGKGTRTLGAKSEPAKRDDVSPKEGEDKYGDVRYADPTNKKYPIDSEEHIRAAWNYIHKPEDANKYSADDLQKIRDRIIAAWKDKIDPKGPPSAADAQKAANDDAMLEMRIKRVRRQIGL